MRTHYVVGLLLVGSLAYGGCDESNENVKDSDTAPWDARSPPDPNYSPPDATHSPPGTTWTDLTSGLTWQNPAVSHITWKEAVQYCANLSLNGGGWRLPTISELRSLIRECASTVSLGDCNLDDDCLSEWPPCYNTECHLTVGCLPYSSSDEGCHWPDAMLGKCKTYWSSSVVEESEDNAWCVAFYNGAVISYYTGFGDDSPGVRCVR